MFATGRRWRGVRYSGRLRDRLSCRPCGGFRKDSGGSCALCSKTGTSALYEK